MLKLINAVAGSDGCRVAPYRRVDVGRHRPTVPRPWPPQRSLNKMGKYTFPITVAVGVGVGVGE